MGLFYNLQKSLFRFIGDIKWSGIKRPFWFTINAKGYMLKGEHYRTVNKVICPGDILIRRFEGYIDKWFIPGFWNHAGIYVGDVDDSPEQVVHAVSEGVIQEDFLNFMRTDHMLILRPKDIGVDGSKVEHAIEKALSVVGKPYDFGFDFKNANRFSCTELVAFCYPGIVKGKKRFGKYTIVADDYAQSDKLSTVWNSLEDETVTSLGVVETFLAKR